MKRNLYLFVFVGLMVIFTAANPMAADTITHPTIMVPAESISRTIKEILPIEIHLGKFFPDDIWLKSVDNLKIEKDRIKFRVLIFGEDIQHTIKLGDQSVVLNIGKVNLLYRCEASFRYDKEQSILFITPQVKDITGGDNLGQGNKVLSPLLEAMSDIEYPIEIQKLDPFITRLGKRELAVSADISRIYTENSMLFVEVIPTLTKRSTQ